jgi:hypothetical protein
VRYSILHVSDLHRDPDDEVDNVWLLDSLLRDRGAYAASGIPEPAICVVSGDLVFGADPERTDALAEVSRQYREAIDFLAGVADEFFDGDRSRIVLLPGNHDIVFATVMASTAVETIPSEAAKRKLLTGELFGRNSFLRWSWAELCFRRIVDRDLYARRLEPFANAYSEFYAGNRTFALEPENQFEVFDFQDLELSVAALNSCYQNDPYHRAGALSPHALAEATRALGASHRMGWLEIATWHHNVGGPPERDDYLDPRFLQALIDAGVSIGLHGHQHMPDCVEERYRVGPQPRKITLVSASTLCGSPHHLTPGIPRSYNVLEIDTTQWVGRVHQRQMVNSQFNMPIWGPGHFVSTNGSYVEFELEKPLRRRPANLDQHMLLEKADALLAAGKSREAVQILRGMANVPLARPLLVRALDDTNDPQLTIEVLSPPLGDSEAVILGAAILEMGSPEDIARFLKTVGDTKDASVKDILRRMEGSRR